MSNNRSMHPLRPSHGTLVSVFLTLLAVPSVYSIFARKTRSPDHVSRLLDRLLVNRPATPEPREGELR